MYYVLIDRGFFFIKKVRVCELFVLFYVGSFVVGW